MDAERMAGGLRLHAVGALRGRSVWAPGPAVAAEVAEGALAGSAPGALAGVAERLDALVPGAGAAAGWAEAIGRVAAGLHERAGAPRPAVRVTPGDPTVLAVETEEEALAVEALHEAAALVRDCIRGRAAALDDAAAELRALYIATHPGPTASVLIEAARRRGIPVRRTDDRVVQLGLGRALRRLDAAMTDRTSVIATDITSDKHRTKRLLERMDLAVPEGTVVRALDDALHAARDLGFPLLLKPLVANDGRGISGRVDTEDHLRAAWTTAAEEHPDVIVERFVPGRDHRVVVVDGRVVAVAERIPAHVVGDGVRSIRALAEAENRANPKRDPRDPASPLVPLPLDELTGRVLAHTGRTPDSVPEAGEVVELRGTANISTGGTAIDRTDEIHPRNAAVCELAAALVGLDIAGIDVLTNDIGVPFDENGAAVIEVNASPGIRMHTDPDVGTPRDVPGAILDMLYPPGAETRIPVVAVTGTNGKTTTTRLIAHVVRRAGHRVGFTTTDGVYFGEVLVMGGDLTGPFAANVVLSDPRVDVAVLETARGGILKWGLGFDACDVGVVLNVTEDHMGQRGIHTLEQLAAVKAVVAESVRPGGHAVLNADDPRVLAMTGRTAGTIVLFSSDSASAAVDAHAAAGGVAVVAEPVDGVETVVLRLGVERIPLLPVAEVPLTIGGAARFQLENVLAATATAHALALSPPAIAEALRTFVPSRQTTPGRLNVVERGGGRVVVDYAHNAAGVRGLLDFVLRMEARRRIGVVSIAGDRRDDDLREIGRMAAALDHVVVKENAAYLRDRAPGESARLIAEGLAAGGLPAERRETILDEHAAVGHALALMEPGDVVVILAPEPARVLAQVEG
jgi:cyanophycin synthetase